MRSFALWRNGLFCLLSLCLSVWAVHGFFTNQHLEDSLADRLHHLESEQQQLKEAYEQNAKSISSFERAKQNGFLKEADQSQLVKLIKSLERSSRVQLVQFNFGDVLTEKVSETFSERYLPVQLQFKGVTEEGAYTLIRSLQAQLPGLIMPARLQMTQVKKHEFLIEYDFFWVVGG